MGEALALINSVRTEGNITMRTVGAARPEGLPWQISSFCNGGTCVQVSHVGGTTFLGDSKNPEAAPFSFSRPSWQHLIDDIKSGRFDQVI
jgi:Domain of unknown function (DUF397)